MERRKGNRRVGAALRAIREELGLDQTAAAFKARISASYLAGIESGTQPLTDSALVKIARGWRVSLERLPAPQGGRIAAA